MRVIGTMSGTSLDGMDLLRLRIEGDLENLRCTDLEFRETAWPEDLRVTLDSMARGVSFPASEFARLHFEVAREFARFVRESFPDEDPAAELAAFPGQTLHHEPQSGFGLQLGNPSVFAALTGIETVGDFRSPDLALGGEGAPLVPLADALLRRDESEFRGILNLGGIANLTLLPPGRGIEGVRAWDTGPGNSLMDQTCRQLQNLPCDRDGAMAASGIVHKELLDEWLSHPYFSRKPPKSTGRELFGEDFLGGEERKLLAERIGLEDLLATLLELSVESSSRALETEGLDALYLCGGGAENPYYARRLRERLSPLPVHGVELLGVASSAKEAMDFAVLAYCSRLDYPVSLSSVTGALRSAPAGCFSSPRGRDFPGGS
ncbi:MAG: anhydro-N-acetylmuramic acid kinase [Candidatus Krumholzibacteria bacterium]|nr:anhydro-N-acetylmuramic acid kinase [Candidatus Krumholzibacteria bacterium]MDP6669075.1 anhydro-N-acetylmuramic acid kinase [Candidatus Krumholzibacteria bacterium]MDP6797190.1 anhydro-N-acetylmuramic acid kinase [Candidatus Krumholzibacteria bacterium]MDP7021905.1 anhydro-N-acetylmuramic acid kinase [Candidatus Krumholzibacteria bacterium]